MDNNENKFINEPDADENADNQNCSNSKPETVRMLRDIRKQFDIPVGKVFKMIQDAGYYPSESSIRRFFRDDTNPATNFHDDIVEAVSAVLLGTDSKNFDPTKDAKTYHTECEKYKYLLKEATRLVERLESEKTRLEVYDQRNWDRERDYRWMIHFLGSRLEYISPEKKKCGCDKCPMIDNEGQKKG